MHVADDPTAFAHEVLVWILRVGIEALRSGIDRDLEDLPPIGQLFECVVNSGATDLRQPGHRSLVHLVGGEVDVLTLQHFGDDPPLRRQAPLPLPEAV